MFWQGWGRMAVWRSNGMGRMLRKAICGCGFKLKREQFSRIGFWWAKWTILWESEKRVPRLAAWASSDPSWHFSKRGAELYKKTHRYAIFSRSIRWGRLNERINCEQPGSTSSPLAGKMQKLHVFLCTWGMAMTSLPQEPSLHHLGRTCLIRKEPAQ